MLYTLRFFLQNAVCFIILTFLVPLLFTFYEYVQCVLKLKKYFRRQKVCCSSTSLQPIRLKGTSVAPELTALIFSFM